MSVTFLTNHDRDDINESIVRLSGEIVGVEPHVDDIPVIFFDGPMQQTKDEAVVRFSYRSKTLTFDCYAEIKGQGDSSLSKPKKNQAVKLYKDADCTEKFKVDFKGWGKQNKFVLKAYWQDITHSRDIVSVGLETDCAKTRADYAELPELLRTSPNLGAIDGFPVKVYADGIYHGRYTLNIPKDKWMANMDDELDIHCILCSEGYGSALFRSAAKIDGSDGDWSDEVHDTVPDAIKTRWNEVITFVQTATDKEFVANLGNYINVNSLIDRHLMGLLSCDYDGYGKNQMYFTYDGQLWYAVPYDKDGTWGAWWTGSTILPYDYDRAQYEDMSDGKPGNLLFMRLEQLFAGRLKERWAELRDGALSLANIMCRFEAFMSIEPPWLVAEDYASTTADGAYTGIPNATKFNIQQLREFSRNRRTWMDEYVRHLISVPCTAISLSDSAISLNGSGAAHTLMATIEPSDTTDEVVWSSNAPAIANVNGGVVTAVSNGSAVITATCGDQSASCTVTVSGIEETAPYALINGEATDDGSVITITNGNHVRVEFVHGTQRYLNLSNINANNAMSDSSNVAYSTKLFDIKSGDVVVRTIKNLTATGDAVSDKSMSVNLMTATGELKFGNLRYDAGEHVGTVTATQDYEVGLVCAWCNANGYVTTGVVEFDLELTVNGEKYI